MKKGLTLLEIMIVVVILAILAGASYPIYMRSVARARESEGWLFLTSIRSSEFRFYTEHDDQFTGTLPDLDLDATQTPLFTYCIWGTLPDHFIGVAVPRRPQCAGCHPLCLDEDGVRGEEGDCPGCS